MLKNRFVALMTAAALVIAGTVPAVSVPAAETVTEESTAAHYTYQLRKDTKFDSLYTKNAKRQLIGVRYDQLHSVNLVNPDNGSPLAVTSSAVSLALKTINKEVSDDDKPFVKQNTKAARKSYNYLNKKSDGIFSPYVCTDELTPVRSDSRVLSVKRDRYINEDGAHGINTVTAYSFDPQTGKRLTLKDVLNYKSSDNLAGILAKEVVKQNSKKKLDLGTKNLKKKIKTLIKGDKYYKGTNDTKYLTWYVSRGGITFFFNPDDLASYAAGTFTVKLTSSKYPDMVKSYYTRAPKNYVRRVTNGDKVNGQKLTFKEKWDKYDMLMSLTIKYGKKSLKLAPYCFETSTWSVNTASGRYIYINTRSENDYQSLYTIDLSAKILKAESHDFGLYDMIPSDPDHMIFQSRGYALSTMNIYRSYKASKDGKLAANTKYILCDSPVLTLKKDVTFDVPDSLTTDTTHKKAFVKGTTMKIFRVSDDQKTADCLTSTGDYVRLAVDTDAYPQKINGIYNEDELLDGASFAG